ncbi:MAG: hypothetical protein COV72_05730 [Candidatus Omnitrophica bacterium CG11_big_fil_rev_8_21_14_0_20_42_13]|uniref:Class III signal peptide-containing protein n=1 Tax=Candidatus Ghiorseimicrobium undicola TaxID=1974746 RepID=A0A2H0LWZ4_9BACT|nr:MAG: hypothetical protein COV72_05730 [Candidatus Omnitrophica bacterium CG11_big_fil_rev_8_21_14_0_20_42_13]
MLRQSRAQNLAEYAIVIAIVATALISMQVYIKRGMQGRLKDLANQISPVQYEYMNTTSSYITSRTGNITENEKRGTTTRVINDETTTRTGSETTVGTN